MGIWSDQLEPICRKLRMRPGSVSRDSDGHPRWPGCLAVRSGSTYRGVMLRIALVIVGAVFVVFVAAAVMRTLFWLALIALIVAVASLAFGGFRARRRSAVRSNRRSRRRISAGRR